MKSDITGKVSANIRASVDNVWEGLTSPEMVKQYFFGTNLETDWKPGSPIKFHGEWEGKKYEDKGTVMSIIPKRLIKYTYWSSMSGIEDKPENYVIVTYDLTENGDSTLLNITQENIPDEKTRKHSEQNWNKVLDGLKKLLEKKTVSSM